MSNISPDEVSQLKANAETVLRSIEQAWQEQVPAQLNEALQRCDETLRALPEEPLVEGTKEPDFAADPMRKERTLLWLWRGRLLVMADQPEAVVQGLRSLDQALARLKASKARDAEEAAAIAWMNRGSGLFRLGSRDSLADAVRSYDQAIELLERAPAGPGNALGVSWMNRGAGLMHLGHEGESEQSDEARLDEASKSLLRAIAILEAASATQPIAQRNLASSWANLGTLRLKRKDPEGALVAQRNAVRLFRPLMQEGNTFESFELAAWLFNLSQAAGGANETGEALDAAREAIALTGDAATADAQAAELGLRARHSICVILGGQIAVGRPLAEDPEQAARLTEAGDLAEEGLAALKARAEVTPGLETAGVRLYEFGAWLYRTQQPQFLGEFLLEHLGEHPGRARVASAAVQAARQAFVQRSFTDTTHGGMERVLDILQSLGEVEARLKERAAVA